MIEQRERSDADRALALLDTALDALNSLDLDSCTGEQLIELWRELESRRRRFAPIDHKIIRQVEQRGLGGELGYQSVVPLARDLLRISAGEARARQLAADTLGARRGLTGERLDPIYPIVSAAQTAGLIGETAAAVLVRTLDRMPDGTAETFEPVLVDSATKLDVDALRKVCARAADVADPDGRLADEAYRERTRELWIHRRSDGSSRFGGEATAELTEQLLTALDVLAQPVKGEDGQRDIRTPGQRRHDGLLEAMKGAIRAGQLPAKAGLTTTVVLKMTDTTLATGQGVVTTGHGATVSMRTVSAWLDGGTRIVPVVLGKFREVAALGSEARLFPEPLRLAMVARDHGCSFPGCDVAPQWTEAHHVIPVRAGGRTIIGNGTLLCRYHHANFESLGWEGQMINDMPHWRPPAWLDPDRTPRRNTAHEPMPDFALV